MVIYLESSASATINVLTSEVATVLTLVAPSDVFQGQSFRMSGELRRADNNQLLAGETITARYNGTPLGIDVTQNGEYNIDGSIDTIGSYTITASFEGSERAGLTLAPSQGIWTINLGIDGITPMVVGGIAALGILLLVVGLAK